MRTLKFLVEGNTIKPDPNCDFSDLIPGTEAYIKAEFIFSPEWASCRRTVFFSSAMGKAYPSIELKDGRTCMIPEELLKRKVFKIKIEGVRNSNYKISTNRLEVKQDGGEA